MAPFAAATMRPQGEIMHPFRLLLLPAALSAVTMPAVSFAQQTMPSQAAMP
jgi:hypothetical protein